MREDARPQPVSPYGVTKLAAEQLCHLYYVNHSVPRSRCAISPSTGRGSGPDMGFPASSRRSWRASRAPVRRRPADPGLHVRGRRRDGHRRGGRRAESPGVSTILAAGPASSCSTCSSSSAGHRAIGLRVERSRHSGRHARHIRGHDAGARRPRLRADGDPRTGAPRPVRLDDRRGTVRSMMQ